MTHHVRDRAVARPYYPLIPTGYDPLGWLRVAGRRLQKSQLPPRPTRRHMEALLELILRNSAPVGFESDRVTFTLTMPVELLDFIAVFGALDEDAEEDDPIEHNDGGDQPPERYAIANRICADDPDLEVDDCDCEDGGDDELDDIEDL